MKIRKRIKRLVKWFVISLGLILVTLFACNYWVDYRAEGFLYNSTNHIPEKKVGLLLGTSKYNRSGRINLFYKYRIDAAVRLFKAGKIEYILVSGDNGSRHYDEPTAFKEDLIRAGIPEDRIYLDYAGFRTLDSIVRAREIFGQHSLTIISQQFHNERALFLARHFNISAVAYNAKDVPGSSSVRVKIREAFARVKMMVDICFGKGPKYLGEPVQIS